MPTNVLCPSDIDQIERDVVRGVRLVDNVKLLVDLLLLPEISFSKPILSSRQL